MRVRFVQTRLKNIEAEKIKLVEELVALQYNNKDLPAIKGIAASEKITGTSQKRTFLNWQKADISIFG